MQWMTDLLFTPIMSNVPNLLLRRGMIDEPKLLSFKTLFRGFPGGSVVKNLPAKAEDPGFIPPPGRFHVLRRPAL